MSAAALAVPAVELYGRGLEGLEPELTARAEGGRARVLPIARWMGALTAADESVLQRATGPVLDIGCGPGRHVLALADRGVPALGLDSSPAAVRVACARGARATEGSVFDDVPDAGSWSSALLLDGNIGIGGDPVALLERVGELLAPDGCVLVELARPGTATGPRRMRLEVPAAASPWFDWATVAAADIGPVASMSGLTVRERWSVGRRWFAALADGTAPV
ncbi:MAG: methyltransferase domain-containing protein [Solirubrobacteraceae bacterium]